jgi:hypothetical protein
MMSRDTVLPGTRDTPSRGVVPSVPSLDKVIVPSIPNLSRDLSRDVPNNFSGVSGRKSVKDSFSKRTVPARVGADAVADLRRSAMNRLKSLNSHTALHSGSALCNGFAFYLKTRSK